MASEKERLKDKGTKLQVVAAGATAGLISRFVVAPLDVVKIRLQLQTHPIKSLLPTTAATTTDLRSGPLYRGTWSTIQHILRHEGLTGLWKGNVPAELMYVCYSAVQFATYRSTTLLLQRLSSSSSQPEQNRITPAVESFIAGAAGGAAATATTYPLDLLRTRFAAQGNDKVYPSLRRAVINIYRDEGPRGYFRGLGPGLGQIIPYMGTFFAAYEALRKPLGRFDMPFGTGDAVAGAAASLTAKTVTFPLDLVRKRIQVQGPTRSLYVHKDIPEYGGAVSAIRTIVAREGVTGLYRGLTVSLLKAAPASAVTMWTYERALRFYVGGEGGMVPPADLEDV